MVKSDLHCHIDNHVEMSALIKILEQAQDNNIENLCILEHSNINLYKTNSILHSLIKNNQLEKYYKGKLISGVEMDCLIKGTTLKNSNDDYNDNISHILVYGFNPFQAEKDDILGVTIRQQKYYNDVDKIVKILQSYDVEVPSKDYIKFDKGSMELQIYNFMKENFLREADYTQKLGLTEQQRFDKSFFIRNLFNDKSGILHIDYESIPTITDVISLAKRLNAKTVIAHPFYMNKKFDGIKYLDALFGLPKVYKNQNNFDGIEADYMLNSFEETSQLKIYANNKNVYSTCGSDYQYLRSEKNPSGDMFFIDSNEQKHYYNPKPGFAIRKFLETNCGDLTMNESFINTLPDIREFYKIDKANVFQIKNNCC